MNNQDYERFLEECQQLPYAIDSQKDELEDHISGYLSNSNNAEGIRRVMETESNPHIKLIMLETLGKIMLTKGKGKVTHNAENGIARSLYTSEIANPQEELFVYFFEIIKYLLGYLKLNQKNNPNFITNSIANLVATYLEVQTYNSGPIQNISRSIIEEFFSESCGPSEYFIGLKLNHYAVNNIIIVSTNYNFFKYRKMLIDFQSGFLYGMFITTKNAVKALANNVIMNEDNPQFLELLRLALEVYFKCLTYPFSLSYFDYKEEFNLEDVTILLFPEAFAPGLADFELYDILINLLRLKVSRDISLEITRILSRCAASRTSILGDDMTKQMFKEKMVESFTQMVYNCPLNEEAFVSEILEAILRIIFVSGIVGIVAKPMIKDSFREAANTLSDAIIILSYRVDSKLSQQLIEFWKKIKPQKDSLGSSTLIARFLDNYFEYNFRDRQQGCFYHEGLKSYKRLKECCDQNFEYFRDLITINLDSSCKLIVNTADFLVSQFESSIVDPQSFDMFLSKFGHFILLFTQAILKTDSYTSYTITRQDSVEMVYFNTTAKVCYVIFDLIGKISPSMINGINPLYRGYLLTTLYFLETFTSIVIAGQIYNAEQDCLIMDDGLFKKLADEYKLAPTFEVFFDTVTDAISNNIVYGSYTVTKSSLNTIKFIVDKLKRTYNGRKKDKTIFDKLCNKLIEKSNVYLTDTKNLKLRTYLYEVIGICYLDEKYYDYIENCHLVLNQILDNNKDSNNQIDLKKILYDINGVYKAISYTKIISVFTKICYPKIQELLNCFGSAHISDSSFIILLIDFYTNLFERSTQNFQISQSQPVTFKIISDACRMISSLLLELNSAIIKLPNYEAVLQFVTANIKLVKRFLKAFESLMKNVDISFSVFHYFGSDEFLTFCRSIFSFLYLVTNCLITHFPDKQPLLYSVLKEGIRCLSDYVLEFFTLEEIDNIFKMILMIFEKRMSTLISENQTKNNTEDMVIEELAVILKVFLTSIYQEYKIYSDNPSYQQKLKQVLANNKDIANEFSLKAIELAYITNSSARQATNLADIIFYLVIVFQEGDVLNNVVNTLISRETDSTVRDCICMSFEALRSRIRPSLDDSNKEDFVRHLNVLIKCLTHGQKTRSMGSDLY